ncbi:MAG: hypothetical protein ETSY2_15330, partial [Candidatus Entotheonella gemina]
MAGSRHVSIPSQLVQSESWMTANDEPGLTSIIIPTYNRAGLLLETLNSVAAQRYRPIEIVVIDDGSTDATEALIRSFERHHRGDPGLSVRYRFQPHQGAWAARTLGLRLSRGAYIQFLDSDDLLHPDKLARQVVVFEAEPTIDFVWSSTGSFHSAPDWHATPVVGWPLAAQVGRDIVIAFIAKGRWKTESGLYRRRACRRTGPWANVAMFQDWEYNIRMLTWSPEIRFVPGLLSATRQHDHERIDDAWYTCRGIAGALRAVTLVEQQTREQFGTDSRWKAAIMSRYRQLSDQAADCGFS